MKTPLLRPTFEERLTCSGAVAVERIRAALAAEEELEGRWRSRGRWVELYLPETERRLWSPYLSLRMDEDGEACRIFGRFAPHPEVWTFFMFLYFLVAFLVLFGAVLGYVQWASDEPAWGLWAVWIGVPVLLLIHLASFLGSRLAQPQMRELKKIFRRVARNLEDGAGG